MFVWAIADRFLDLVGIFALLLWTVKGTLRFSRWWNRRRVEPSPPKPRAFRLNSETSPENWN